MFKLLTKPFYSASNMLKNFGIVNPNVLRNLSYLLFYVGLVNFMKQDWESSQLIQTHKAPASPPLVLLLPSPEREQGNLLNI